MASDSKQKIVVVGAGPVGALAALYAAKRGHHVQVYELRSDLRLDSTTPLGFTRSINLALSERGINSIRQAQCPGLLDTVLAQAIPMHGRMVHQRKDDGSLSQRSQKYDAHGRFIRAVDRADLNKQLLNELERMPNVELFFDHKLTGADFKRKLAWFEKRQSGDNTNNKTNRSRDEEIERSFDLMLGADGAHSAVRFHLMKFTRLSYQQEYIDTLWCEFHIAPTPSGDFAIDPHHLHIWPAGSFMFIAIPSADRSFTCTLFMPAPLFDTIDAAPASLVPFFDTHFPGVAGTLIPAPALRHQYATNPHLPLISIKCAPYHYAASAVILGDAAHAMVPFYGQGMNAGLEDVRVLFQHFDASPHDTAAALAAYTATRRPDAHAIIDFAMGNYAEMRKAVTDPVYLARKAVEEWLSVHVPASGFATQYARISFGNERYSDVAEAVRRQSSVLGYAGAAVATAVLAAAGVAARSWWLRRR